VKYLAALNLPTPVFLEKYLSYLFPVVVFVFAFYLQYLVAFFGLDLHHDLFMFDAARNFYSGQIPYKDFFYQYNLGTLFLHGAALSILGLKIVSLKKITVLSYALIALLIYLSCALEGYRRSGFLLSILWTLLSPFYMLAMNGYHPWSTVYMMVGCMAGLFFLQLASRKTPLVYSLIAGVFFSLSFWFKQVAAYQIIAVAIWLVVNIWLSMGDRIFQRKYIKIFLGYAAGGVLTSIPFFSYLYAESAILDWWTDAFAFNKYFSADSQNASGIESFLKILFPISRDMGYQSFFWALNPLVLCVGAFQVYFFRGTSFGLSQSQKKTLALFVLAGFAGWFEYYPLPHPFHTQIFMAPTFVVIGMLLGKHPVNFREIKGYFLIFLAIYIFIVSVSYEGIRHIKGLNQKRFLYNNDSISVNFNSPFDGLNIVGGTEKLTNFYQHLVELKTSSKDGEFIPLSVDPIRGLLPGEVARPSEFKMGVDWTWPNELIEPGFSEKINSKIKLHQQPIYADSLIYIPGYKPIAVLEMAAPISWTHTLYKPHEEDSKLLVEVKNKNEILYVTYEGFNVRTRNILFGWNFVDKRFNFIPFDGLSELEIKDIRNIHMSVIEERDFPPYLSALQMGSLKKVGKYYGGELSELFRLDDHGGGVLRQNINIEDKKNLAFFMLSTGKFFKSQNRPIYLTTLAYENLDRPMLVSLSMDSPNANILWSSKIGIASTNGAIYKDKHTQVYLAVKHLLNEHEYKFIIVQVELQNGQMKNYFYSFLDDQK